MDAVERMAYSGAVPWHGKGTYIDDADVFNPDYFRDKSGLLFDVYKDPLQCISDGKSVPELYAIRRNDNGKILGNCGHDWQPLQNADAFEWFRPYLESQELMLHTAGSLYDGRWVWVLAQLNRPNSVVVPGDEIAKFVLLANPHSGKNSIRLGFTKIRVVCRNTMYAAFSSELSNLVKIRHGRNNVKNLEDIKTVMDMANGEFEATNEQLRYLTTKTFNTKTLGEFIKELVLGKEDKDISTRSKNIMEQIIKLIETGRGQDNPRVRGTWYAAYQGYNEFINYHYGHDKHRLYNVFLDKGQQKDKQALELALTLAV